MEITNRKSIFDSLKKYDILSAKEEDFIEVTEWTNGEGWDITISTKNRNFTFGLTWGELKAIKKLIKQLDKHESRADKRGKVSTGSVVQTDA